jgi:hypothetical protein
MEMQLNPSRHDSKDTHVPPDSLLFAQASMNRTPSAPSSASVYLTKLFGKVTPARRGSNYVPNLRVEICPGIAQSLTMTARQVNESFSPRGHATPFAAVENLIGSTDR